jgi:hypothetical protein
MRITALADDARGAAIRFVSYGPNTGAGKEASPIRDRRRPSLGSDAAVKYGQVQRGSGKVRVVSRAQQPGGMSRSTQQYARDINQNDMGGYL